MPLSDVTGGPFTACKDRAQHTRLLEIEQTLRNDCAQDADKARHQRLAPAQTTTEAQMKSCGTGGTVQGVVATDGAGLPQDPFTRLSAADRMLPPAGGGASAEREPGELRARRVNVGRRGEMQWLPWSQSTIGWRGSTRFATATVASPACTATGYRTTCA